MATRPNAHPDPHAVSLHEVVKQYRMHHQKGRTIKEAFLRQKIYQETRNALDRVSFSASKGTTLGIIGSNGSGKSTALKLIARTCRPTSGRVDVNGRVSALLELGAGFHPDFTGRENVYLDGAIMGLPRRVIDERLDEIIEFAGLGNYIDAPAKTYSSGMYLRLAFSVAVSVDPDIVLIDEVFAVGDAAFQRKCLERIDEFKSRGKTIVFVSHSLEAVRSLCDEAVWIEQGVLKATGSTDRVTDFYLAAVNEREEERLAEEDGYDRDERRWGTRRALLTSVQILDDSGQPRHTFATGDPMKLRLAYQAKEKVEEPVFGVAITRSDGVLCFGSNTSDTGDTPDWLEAGEGNIILDLQEINLLPGDYYVSASLHNLEQTETYDYHDRKFRFKVLEGPDVEIGLVHLPHTWPGWKQRG